MKPIFSTVGNFLKNINWWKVGEYGGIFGGGVLTMLGTWCGTRNAAKDRVDELLEENTKVAEEIRKEDKEES